MNLNQYLDVAPEVKAALDAGKPVVALESTIISHGMPYPQNVETALNVEKIIRENGATPATIAIIGGRLKAGLSREEIEHLGKKGYAVTKASRRDLPVIVARSMDGATTVATTMIIAEMAGIRVFATGGIGGVHRGAEVTMDISADLEELAQTGVMVICAGAKSILDLGLTLEYLETKGVPVIGYGTDELPAFYTRKSGFGVDYRIDTPEELAAAFRAKLDMGLRGGMLVANPIPEEYSMDPDVINKAIDEAIEESKRLGIHGKQTTPFLLAKVKDITGGDSLASNIRLVYNNAPARRQDRRGAGEVIPARQTASGERTRGRTCRRQFSARGLRAPRAFFLRAPPSKSRRTASGVKRGEAASPRAASLYNSSRTNAVRPAFPRFQDRCESSTIPRPDPPRQT